MGLDMYLTKSHFISEYPMKGQETSDRERLRISGIPAIKTERVQNIIEQVGYWRKAHEIHRWFVNEVQNGVDNCAEYEVSADQLKSLVKFCKAEMKNDTSKGDAVYLEDLRRTIQILTEALKEDKKYPSYSSFYYRASW